MSFLLNILYIYVICMCLSHFLLDCRRPVPIHATSVFSWPTLQVLVVAWLVSVACWCLLLVVGYINIFVCWLLTVDCSFVIVRLWFFEFNLLLFGVWWCLIDFWFMSDGLVIFVAWWLFHCPNGYRCQAAPHITCKGVGRVSGGFGSNLGLRDSWWGKDTSNSTRI